MTFFNGIYVRTPGVTLADATAVLGRHWVWLLATGIASLVLGIGALIMPIASTIGITFALAGILVAGAIVHLVQAVKLRHEQGGLIRFLQSVLALVVGGLIFFYPGIGMLGITLSLGFYFLVGATMHWLLASAMAPGSPRGWFYLNAITSFILGVYIITSVPTSAFWVPGMLLGIDFVFAGTAMIGHALACRKLYRKSLGIDTDKKSKHLPGCPGSRQPT